MRLRTLSRVGAHLMPLVLGAGALEDGDAVEGPFSFSFFKMLYYLGCNLNNFFSFVYFLSYTFGLHMGVPIFYFDCIDN